MHQLARHSSLSHPQVLFVIIGSRGFEMEQNEGEVC